MGIGLLHYIFLKRKLVLLVTLVFFVVSVVFVALSGRNYETKALLIPPIKEGGEGFLSAWMAQLNLPSTVVPTSAGPTSAAILVDILRSRRLGEMIISSLGLKGSFKVETMDDAIAVLQAKTKITVTNTGLIRLSVKDEDPEQAVRIASFYIAGLDSLNRLLQFTRAGYTMEFIYGQIEKYRKRLSRVRENIAKFQKEHGIVNFEEQVRGAIDVAADLKVRTILAQIERDLLREFARKDAVELRRKEAEYRNLTLQLQSIMEGDSSDAVFVPLSHLPELYLNYAAMQRDLEVNERVYSFLLQRYEESGIDKARNTPTIQVVDDPNLPEKPSGIPKKVIVLVVTLVGFVWISSVVAWWGWLNTRKRSEVEEQAFQDILSLVRQDLEKLRRILHI